MVVRFPGRLRDLVDFAGERGECGILELRSKALFECGSSSRRLGIPLRGSGALPFFSEIEHPFHFLPSLRRAVASPLQAFLHTR
jgi:hypothetical protein